MNKKQEILERKYLLRERAVFDSEYRRLMADLKKEEMRLDAAEMGMTHAQRNAMWDFLMRALKLRSDCWNWPWRGRFFVKRTMDDPILPACTGGLVDAAPYPAPYSLLPKT